MNIYGSTAFAQVDT